jgi:GMP synthase (glutamine-hydrolysing)
MAIVVLEHSRSTGAERLATTLRDYGHRLRVIRPDQESLPADLDDVDGIIATGGPQSSKDNDDWLNAEMDLLRQADAQALPVVGICLGAQILTRALGGEVGAMDGGIELGWHPLDLTPAGCEDPLHAGFAWRSVQFHWHRDQVTTPPPDSRVLAKSERCAVQVWTRGLRTYALQYHPEITPATVVRWATEHPGDLDEAGLSLEDLRRETDRHYPDFARLTQRLFESIALFLVPSDRRYGGLVKDLHH